MKQMTKKRYTACIIDDEKGSIDALRNLIDNYAPELEIKDCFTDPLLALNSIKPDDYDLLFIDINMPEISGFDLIERMGSQVAHKTVIITGYSENTITAFKIGVFDFIEKPFILDDILLVIKNYQSRIGQLEDTNYSKKEEGQINLFLINGKDRTLIVRSDEIVYFRANTDSCYLNLTEDRTLKVGKNSQYFYQNSPETFVNAGKGIHINYKHFREKVKSNYGGQIVLSDGTEVLIPVFQTRRFFAELAQLMNIEKIM